jgi:cyclase
VNLLLENGADKISINTAAVKNPGLIDELAANFGSQCIVVAIDTNLISGQWTVVTHGGRNPTELFTVNWAREVTRRGAGEILLTSMQHDGTKNGFATDITKEISETVSIPVIASGGAGRIEHFAEVFKQAHADAALAASIFHFKEIPIPQLKKYLAEQDIPVRI